MNDNLGSDYFLLAHVDRTRVRYTHSEKLGIEFKNEIDAWNKMAFKFRGARCSEVKYARKDLRPLVYSVRSAVEW
jgi:hypothetical protein